MDFDWTTFFLEIINFLVLVWILKRFLYHPILGVVARRRAGIEKAMADARRIEAEAGELKQQSQRELAQWKEDKEAAQAHLREELAAERERLMAEMEIAVAEERERRRVLEERQQVDFKRAVEEQGIAQGAAFAARLLSRVATPELEARLYALLLEDLRGLRAEDKRAVADAAAPGLQLKVQSAFALDAARRAELAQALAEVAGKVLPVEYVENPELLAGFQVSIGPWILHANLRDELKFFSGALRHAG
ncbi:MAG: F0F1 ATP synthase subunit delta [Betaproteobacteria bacterium]|nr:F0F1 ATP synthase subunit delta [Betaproteobacteria bacterium]